MATFDLTGAGPGLGAMDSGCTGIQAIDRWNPWCSTQPLIGPPTPAPTEVPAPGGMAGQMCTTPRVICMDTRTGRTWAKRRGRRKRLVTATDLRDLVALGKVLGPKGRDDYLAIHARSR